MTEKTNPTTGPADDIEPDELDDDVDETSDEENDENDGTEAEWTPPTRQEWEAQQARLATEQGKLKRAREQARKLREGGRAGEAAASPEAAAAAQADVQKWQSRAVTTAARAELLARGAEPDMVDLALGRLKVSEIEFGDDDQPDLEEWLDEMQDRYPRLFKAPEAAAAAPVARPRPGKVEAGGKAPVRPKLSLGQQIIANSSRGIRPNRRP